jgi:hypothetical protein
MQYDWPFKDPENVAVFTVRQIVRDGFPVLRVAHNSDDGAWQFLQWETPREEDAMILCLREIVDLDPTIRDLADLPLGWRAIRPSADSPWQRDPNPENGL